MQHLIITIVIVLLIILNIYQAYWFVELHKYCKSLETLKDGWKDACIITLQQVRKILAQNGKLADKLKNNNCQGK
jgi:hypothetical protein